MKDHVQFEYPAPFIGSSEGGDVIGVEGVEWFDTLLSKVTGFSRSGSPIQEDWGVVFFMSSESYKFWVGISWYGENNWIAHVHQSTLKFMLPFTGRNELTSFAESLDTVLQDESRVKDVRWCDNRSVSGTDLSAHPTEPIVNQ
jgi:hypothetical protein